MSNQVQHKFATLTRINQIVSCSIDGMECQLSEFIRFYKKGIIEGWIKLIQDTETTLIYQY